MDNIEAKMGFNGNDDRTDAFGGWRSARPGSIIEFSFQVPAAYNNYASEKYSVGIVIRRFTQNSGQVKMWLDNNKKAKGSEKFIFKLACTLSPQTSVLANIPSAWRQ